MFVYIILVLTLCLLAFVWVKKRYNYWTDHGVPQLETSFPFGNLKGVGTSETQAVAIQALYNQFKGKVPFGGIYFFLGPTLLPIDLELIKLIFIKEFSSFHSRGFYYNKKDDPLSANMLTLEGQEWRDVRVKLTPIFTSGKMKMMFGIIDEIGDKLVEVLKKEIKSQNEFEMEEWLAKFSTDVIGNIAFGFDSNCLNDPNSEFRKHGKRVFDVTTYESIEFLFASTFPNLARRLRITTTPKEAAEFFLNTFISTIEQREKESIVRKDFVQLLLQMKNSKEGKVFTNTELASESFIFYAAGFGTSSTVMTFCLYEMALNPDMQEKLRGEIKETLEDNDGKLTYENLLGMKYLDEVVNETLRKYPPIPSTSRKCNKECAIPGSNFVIPSGMVIEIPIYSLHHDPEYYPDPEKFDPERFDEEIVKTRNPMTFLPFGDGPRNCIGMRFGLIQSKIGIVKVLSNFKVEICGRTPIVVKFEPAFLNLAPVGGMWLKISPLNE